MKHIIIMLAFVVFVLGAVFGCKPAYDEKSPMGLMQTEIRQILTFHAGIAGCEVPLKLTQYAEDPEAQKRTDFVCHQLAGGVLAEALRRDLSPSQTFTLECIRSSFDAVGLPNSSEEATKILEFCANELGASQGK